MNFGDIEVLYIDIEYMITYDLDMRNCHKLCPDLLLPYYGHLLQTTVLIESLI